MKWAAGLLAGHLDPVYADDGCVGTGQLTHAVRICWVRPGDEKKPCISLRSGSGRMSCL